MATLEKEASPKGATVRIEAAAFVQDPDSMGFLEGYLRESIGGEVHLAEGGTRAAINFLTAAEYPPRILLIDLSGADTPLSEVDRLAEVCEPSIVVIALGEAENVYLFRELIRAGVTDYVIKPLSPDQLDPYVRERRTTITAATGTARRGKIVAVSGSRGGVGSTSLAVNVAWLLANELKRRVALIDLDLHAGAACVQLGLEPGGLVDVLTNHGRLDSLFLERTMVRHGQRLAVLAEEMPLAKDSSISFEALDGMLDMLSEDFHFVIVDLPRTFGSIHAHAFNKAGTRVVVCDRTLPSLRDSARLLELAGQTEAPSIVIVNDHHPGLTGIIDDATIAEAMGRKPDIAIAYDKAAAHRTDNLGDVSTMNGTPLALGTQELAAMLTGRARGRKRSWFRRLLARGSGI